MTNKNKNKKLNRKDRAVIERKELKARLLEKYVEGETNIDYDQLSSDEIWKVVYPFPLSTEKKDKGKNLESIKERGKILGRKFPLIAKKEWIEREIAKIESKNPKVTAHKVQDPIAKSIKYRQKFVQSIKETQPQIIKDLKKLAPVFRVLFAKESKKNYYDITDNLRHQLLQLWRIQPDYTKASIFDFDRNYKWGALQKAFYLARDRNKHFNSKVLFDSSNERVRLIEGNHYLLNNFDNVIKNAFDETAANRDRILQGFFHIQGKIYEWSEKYHLQKDWLVDYAYYFIYQFSQNSNLKTENIEIGSKNYSYGRTKYVDFEFKAAGWWAAEDGETASQYKARVTKEFNRELERYINEASAALKLSELPKFTKPPTYRSVKYLVYGTVKGWSAERIVEKFFSDIAADKTKDESSFLTFENKIKLIKSEMRKLKDYDLPMPEYL